MDNSKTRIGKDVIESLTFAMYDDPRFIYREYIQNSADQIDIAFENNFITSKEESKIEIKIDKVGKNISIYDNGTGIPKDKVLLVLKNIAQGVKDRTKHKGFRGIGRLGGLAYCDELIFETSYFGETTKSILTWNAKKLKQIINNRDKKEEASEVIDTITSLETEPAKENERFFRVILKNISNEILLDKSNIIDYLSMVAPVPYKNGFYYDEKIYKKASELGYTIDEYNIYVNNNQIFKEYTTTIYEKHGNGKKRVDSIHDVDFFEIKNSTNELLCWGWYSLSEIKAQMKDINIARGIRLRKSNIQIGDENRLANLFVASNVQDKRFSFYFFGEIHAVSPDLIPNARRDYFTENKTFEIFEKETKSEFKKLKEYCYFSSNVRSEERKIQKFIDFTAEYKTKNQKGFTKSSDKKKLDEKFDELKGSAKKAKQKIERIGQNVENDKTKNKIFEKITKENKTLIQKVENKKRNNNSKPKLISDGLSKHNRNERKLVSKILGIIDNILPKDLSENVKQKIVEELNK
jgi:molecular chaperone HtpG